MPDEFRDPEFDLLREHWDAPSPAPDLHRRVLAACANELAAAEARRRWFHIRIPLPVAGMAVILAAAIAWFAASYFHPAPKPAPPAIRLANHRYQPVAQPRFIVISRGEHP